jgi:hypothetical protein
VKISKEKTRISQKKSRNLRKKVGNPRKYETDIAMTLFVSDRLTGNFSQFIAEFFPKRKAFENAARRERRQKNIFHSISKIRFNRVVYSSGWVVRPAGYQDLFNTGGILSCGKKVGKPAVCL